MKFTEIKEIFDKDIKNELPIEEKLKDLQIDKYITLSEKMYILQGTEEEPGMIDNILKQDEGLWSLNKLAYEMYLIYNVCNWYGNIEFDGFDNDTYDWIMEHEIFEYITDQTNDYWKFEQILNDILKDELFKRNSIQGILSRGISMLLEKINDLTDTDKMEKMLNLANEALAKNPDLKEIIGSNFKQIKKVKSGAKKK